MKISDLLPSTRTSHRGAISRGLARGPRLMAIFALVAIATFGCTDSPPAQQQPLSTPPVEDDRGTSTPETPEDTAYTSVLPKTNEQGDFIGKSNHLYWEVVDPDPQGLNCRMGNSPLSQIWDPRTGALEIGSFPVKGTLQQNQTFEAKLTPGGFVITFDSNNNPWIFVESSAGENSVSNCFVRANEQYVKPVSPAAS